MVFIAVSGEPGCRHGELARVAAERLECELVTEANLDQRIAAQFGETNPIPDRAWRLAAASVLVNLALDYPQVIVCGTGVEILARDLPGAFRFHVTGPESVRLKNLEAEFGVDRAGAKRNLQRQAAQEFQVRKKRFGQKNSPVTGFDLVVNAGTLELAGMLELLIVGLRSRGLLDAGPLPAQTAAQIQFRLRFEMARHGVVAPYGIRGGAKAFGHPSEAVFANLLDFYRIAWDYEPRSFPLQWDKDGRVSEAFTPDFYLPEFDLYVELTTMKQANVTRKNRKVRLLRAIYPHVNIQIFYKKDVQDLVLTRRLPESLARSTQP